MQLPGLVLRWGLEEPGRSHTLQTGPPSPSHRPARLRRQGRAPNPAYPSLPGSPEKEAFKKRAKLQQENGEETDENEDNEAEEVRPGLPPSPPPACPCPCWAGPITSQCREGRGWPASQWL